MRASARWRCGREIANLGVKKIRAFFPDGTENSGARQQVTERIGQADLPADAKPQLGPLSSVIGEVYRYTLESQTMPLYELIDHFPGPKAQERNGHGAQRQNQQSYHEHDEPAREKGHLRYGVRF